MEQSELEGVAAYAAPSDRKSRSKEPVDASRYEAVLDWEHYEPAPRAEQVRMTSVSVGEMYWRMVSPIRAQARAPAPTHAAVAGTLAWQIPHSSGWWP